MDMEMKSVKSDGISRRTFLGASAGFAAATAFGGGRDEKPLFTMGLMCDTHVGGRPLDPVTRKRNVTLGTERIRMALELMKRLGCDYVVNVGDVCDLHFPEWYPKIRETFESVFPTAEKRPHMWYVYAGHDVIRFNGHDRSQFMADRYPALDEMHDLLKAENPQKAWVTDIKGIPVVLFREWSDKEDDYEGTLKKVCAANPGKPVLVFDHYPAYGTFWKAVNGGYVGRRAVLDRFPQVVHISAHLHNTLQDESEIWQGNFTAVNCGCLFDWSRTQVGALDHGAEYQGWNVMRMEVYSHSIVFRRYDIRDGREYRPFDPWTIPLPFVAAEAPYAPARRKLSVPQFGGGATLSASVDEKAGLVRLDYPANVGEERAFGYLEEFFRRGPDGKWMRFHVRERVGDYWMREVERTGRMSHQVPFSFFDPDREYRVTVSPVNFRREAGNPIETTFRTPKAFSGPKPEVTFVSADPMRELEFRLFGKDDPPIPQKDGWAAVKGGKIDVFGRMLFPERAFAGEVSERFRITLEFRVQGNAKDRWFTYLTAPQGGRYVSDRIRFDFADRELQRVVIDWTKSGTLPVPALTFCHFGAWEEKDNSLMFRVESVKVEKMK